MIDATETPTTNLELRLEVSTPERYRASLWPVVVALTTGNPEETGLGIARTTDKGYARRIVAALNACDGIEVETLESMAAGTLSRPVACPNDDREALLKAASIIVTMLSEVNP